MRVFDYIIFFLLLFFALIYLGTRGLPSQNLPTKAKSPHPNLPVVLQNAKNSISLLISTLQNIKNSLQSSYKQHVESLIMNAIAMGLTTPDLKTLDMLLSSANLEIDKYQNILAIPNCMGTLQDCGYFTDITSSTETTPIGNLLRYTDEAESASTQAIQVSSTLRPIGDNINNIISFISSDAQAKSKDIDNITQECIQTLRTDSNQLSTFASIVEQQTNAMRKDAEALNIELIG